MFRLRRRVFKDRLDWTVSVSGDLEIDLTELFADAASVATDLGVGIALFIDEMQDVPPVDVAADTTSILVVDDDPLVLSTTVEMLCFAGYDAVGASSANQALKLLNQSAGFSVLVTDHAMPGMTGTELAASLAESHPSLRVILASGYAELPAETPGIMARLQKPYGRADLLAAIRSG